MSAAMLRRLAPVVLLAVGIAQGQAAEKKPTTDFKFSFGPGQEVPGFIQVDADTFYSADQGYGFELFTAIPSPGTGAAAADPRPSIEGIDRERGRPAHSHFVTSRRPFLFSVAVPPGNYRVTLTLGDLDDQSTTTVKAEGRLLMVENLRTRAGQISVKSFAVNVRNPNISAGGQVKLNPREIGALQWDDKLTLEFSGARPALCAMEVHKIEDAVTLFLCGDSTLANQPHEPYGTWGQMLPRWFDDHVAVANYAESGETLKGFKNERRWEKVMSELKPGDYVFLQFGNNDANKSGRNAVWPADDPAGDWSLTYSEAGGDFKQLLIACAAEVKKKRGIPMIVSPATKIQSDAGIANPAGLGEYPKAAREAAQESGAGFIDLSAMSVQVVGALGPDAARLAYVDSQHTTSYGGYLLARCVVEGIRKTKLDVEKYLTNDAGTFDPAKPLPLPAEFKVPLETVSGGAAPARGRGMGTATSGTRSSNPASRLPGSRDPAAGGPATRKPPAG